MRSWRRTAHRLDAAVVTRSPADDAWDPLRVVGYGLPRKGMDAAGQIQSMRRK
jgi:hypothetical protein